jgi:hypothetical protein
MNGLLAISVALSSPPSSLAGAKITIQAVVLKVDREHRRALIRYAALDTAPGGVREVAIGDISALRTIRAGEPISAVADTSHTPWVISNVVETSR